MPVFSVKDKYNATVDFINYTGGGGPTFTVTQPKQLTDINTSILDPDGTEAVVSDYSAVVYKLDKKINTKFAKKIKNRQENLEIGRANV